MALRHGLLSLPDRQGEIDDRLASDGRSYAPADNRLEPGFCSLEFIFSDAQIRQAKPALGITRRRPVFAAGVNSIAPSRCGAGRLGPSSHLANKPRNP
jgi:hypothetical protein